MTTQVIVLNGGSSSGKSGIARCLQAVLPDPWLALGVDMLVQAMPPGIPAGRGDRVTGMAASQAEVVHQGVVYDLRVDTTRTEALDCARAIAARVR